MYNNDRKKIKSDHILTGGNCILDITQRDIAIYLTEVKEAIKNDRYKIERHYNRQDNIDLFLAYIIDEKKAKEILLSLTTIDFSEVLQNEHKGYEDELLYVFGKDVELLKRMGHGSKTISLYIKLNKLDNCYVIVVSFHEQKYPIKYYFK